MNTNPLKLYTQLMRATNTVTDRMHKHLQAHKLSISQFGVMEALHHLGPMCQKEIGAKILKTSGNITMVIDNLEKRELVKRIKNPSDRRRVNVHLTHKGASMMTQIMPRHWKVATDVFSVLAPDEQKTLALLLKKLGKRNLELPTTSKRGNDHAKNN